MEIDIEYQWSGEGLGVTRRPLMPWGWVARSRGRFLISIFPFAVKDATIPASLIP
jgi:hypothetical protein